MSGVKNQNPCGSCWAFAAASVSEGIQAITNRLATTLRTSEQESLDCVFNYGCNGGGACAWYLDWHTIHGMVPIDDYPYTGVKNASCLNQTDRKKIMKV